jgi:hypothetical protein
VRLRRAISFIVLTLLTVLLCSCGGGLVSEGGVTTHDDSLSPSQSLPPQDEADISASPSSSARIIVTRSFNEPAILEETLIIDKDTTALEALQTAASIETKYGGGFVRSIAGIGSKYEGSVKEKEDWFFYINGSSLSTGASGYILQDGDSQHWDFHDWSFRQFIPAIIGDFPEPFVHGIRGVVYPTVVAYQSRWEEEARHIADRLGNLGVQNVTHRSFSELSAEDKETNNLVLVGTSDFEPIEELDEHWTRLGFFCHFEDGKLLVFDSAGDLVNRYGGGTGLIQATQSIWNSKGIGAAENVVWMVTGLDDTAVTAAGDTLTENYSEFKYACAVVIAGGEIIRVPQ